MSPTTQHRAPRSPAGLRHGAGGCHGSGGVGEGACDAVSHGSEPGPAQGPNQQLGAAIFVPSTQGPGGRFVGLTSLLPDRPRPCAVLRGDRGRVSPLCVWRRAGGGRATVACIVVQGPATAGLISRGRAGRAPGSHHAARPLPKHGTPPAPWAGAAQGHPLTQHPHLELLPAIPALIPWWLFQQSSGVTLDNLYVCKAEALGYPLLIQLAVQCHLHITPLLEDRGLLVLSPLHPWGTTFWGHQGHAGRDGGCRVKPARSPWCSGAAG